jgi:putative transcriptional regulator
LICTREVGVHPRRRGTLARPVHHVPQEILVAYACGTTTAPVELLVASHLTFCAACRARVADAEAVGGALLLGATPAAMEHLPDVEAGPVPVFRPPTEPCPVLPHAIRSHTGPLAGVAWRRVGAGLRIAPVELGGEPQRIFLLELPARFRVPTHRHRGRERVLVLQGGFTDRNRAFGVGDVAWNDDAGHSVRIDDDGHCIALFVNDGPFVVGGALGTRLLDHWLRR